LVKNTPPLGNESSLHSSIRGWYARPGDKFEVRVGNFVVDLVRDDLLIEIQTRNFSVIKKKMESLVEKHNVRLVYPIPLTRWILRVSQLGGVVVSRRKSPKKGRLIDVFDELVRMPCLIKEENFTLEVLMIEEEEVRCSDGKGSWRRRGVSIKDRTLLDVVERVTFTNKEDFLRFVPQELPQPFTNRSIANSLEIPLRLSRRMTYSLKKMGAIKAVGRSGKEFLFETAV